MKYFPLSYSRISALECPFYFFKRYVLKEPGLSTAPLAVGQFIHSVIEKYNKQLMKNKIEADQDIFKTIFEQEWQAEKHLISAESYEELKNTLLNFAEHYNIIPQYAYGAELNIAIDTEGKETDWFSKNILARIKIDYVNAYGEKAYIVDYKSHFRIPSDTDIKNSMQGKLYAWALHKINPYFNQFDVVYYYVRPNAKRIVTYTTSDLENIEDWLRSVSQKINDRVNKIKSPDDWEARISSNCTICPFTCPLVKAGYSNVPVQTEGLAVDAGMQILALQNQVKKLRAGLIKWSGLHGPVDIGDGVYLHAAQESYKIKPAEMIQFCLDNGLEVNDFVNVNLYKIKHLEKDLELFEKFKSVSTPVVKTLFQYQIKKGESK